MTEQETKEVDVGELLNKPKPCDVCGRDCISITGVLIELIDDEEKNKEIAEVRELFGKTEFRVCFPCYLLSLGIKPKPSLHLTKS